MVDRIGHRTLWTFVITSIALVMVTLDNLVVSTALPVIRTDLGASIEDLEWTVNAYTLTFAVFLLTGAALGDRFGRRRMFVDRPRDLHGGLGARRARADDRGARRRPGAAGPRRRDRRAAHADAPQRGGAGRAPRPRARRLGRHRRPRRRPRPARRRRRHRGPVLAVDLLDQRADRPRPHAARLAAPGRDARPAHEPRPARARARQRRPLRHRLGPRPRQRPGLDEPGDRGRRSPPASLLVAAFVLWELRAREPMLPMRFFANRTFSHANVASLFMFFGMFGSIFLLAQFFQTVQGYSALQAGLRILPWTAMPMFVAPIAGALSDRIGGHRIMGVGLTLQADRPRVDRGRVDADDAVLRARHPVHALGHRHGALLRAGRERRAEHGAAAGGGAGLGRQQRHPRARRRVRRRRAGLDLRAGSAATRPPRASSTAWCRRSRRRGARRASGPSRR